MLNHFMEFFYLLIFYLLFLSNDFRFFHFNSGVSLYLLINLNWLYSLFSGLSFHWLADLFYWLNLIKEWFFTFMGLSPLIFNFHSFLFYFLLQSLFFDYISSHLLVFLLLLSLLFFVDLLLKFLLHMQLFLFFIIILLCSRWYFTRKYLLHFILRRRF